MKQVRPLPLIALVLSFLAALARAESQPQMHDALDALHRAKADTDAAKNLAVAKKALAHSSHDKAYYRREALALVEKAQGALEAHDRVTTHKCIDEAIAKIEKGIQVGKKKKK